MIKLLVTALLAVKVSSSCHTADIMSTIGGNSYTVNSVTATHFVFNSVPYLAVAGKITKTSVSSAFLYVYDYNNCKMKTQFEL